MTNRDRWGWDPERRERVPIVTFRPRVVPESLLGELSQLWHTSRTACQPSPTRYTRMIWASGEYHKAHPETSATGAYKDLEAMLTFGGR